MKKFSLLLICLFFGQQLIACSCSCTGYYQNLCELLSDEKLTSLAEAVLLEKSYNSDKLQLIQNLYGTQVVDSIFHITLPSTCNEGVYADIGDTVLLNFADHIEGDSPQEFFETDTLSLFTCQYLGLKRQGGQIVGSISPSINQMSFTDFVNYLEGAYQGDINCKSCRCYCFWNWSGLDILGPFCQTLSLSNEHHQENTLVARIVVEETTDFSSTASIVEILQGEESKESLKIWHTQGEDCRAVSTFEIGKEYLVNLKRLNEEDRRAEEEQVGDYELHKCGTTQLSISGESVSGFIANGVSAATYSTIKEDIQNGDFTEGASCIWGTSIASLDQNKPLIYPNPCKDQCRIESTEMIQTLQLFNIGGELLKDLPVNQKEVLVNMSDYPNGLYLCKLETVAGIITRKIYKI